MQQESTKTLFQYWNRLRDGRPAPRRSEIEPADIKSLLADTFILESDMRGEAVFRLAGTRVCATYGRELKGFSFPSIWRTRDQRMISKLTKGVFADQTVAAVTYEAFNEQGRSVTFEMLLLPLEFGGESSRCLGISTACAYTYWLGAYPVVDTEIASIRVLDPDGEPLKNAPVLNIPAQPNRPASALSNANPASRRVRHLIVMDGGLSR